MLNILIVNSAENQVETLQQTLSKKAGVRTVHAMNAKFALERISFQEIDLVIVAEELPDSSGCDFIETLTKINPFIPTTMMSDMAHDDFHEKTEGLGVLMQLSLTPDEGEITKLLNHIENIAKLMCPASRVAA